MNFKIYVDSIIQKMQDAGYYSEMGENTLRLILEQHLINEYNNRVAALNLQVDVDKAKGSLTNTDWYKSQVLKIKRHIVYTTKELEKIHLED